MRTHSQEEQRPPGEVAQRPRADSWSDVHVQDQIKHQGEGDRADWVESERHQVPDIDEVQPTEEFEN